MISTASDMFLEGSIIRVFHYATDEEIKNGLTTDIYFSRTKQILEAKKMDRLNAIAEVTSGRLPDGWPWGVLCGKMVLLDKSCLLHKSLLCATRGRYSSNSSFDAWVAFLYTSEISSLYAMENSFWPIISPASTPSFK